MPQWRQVSCHQCDECPHQGASVDGMKSPPLPTLKLTEHTGDLQLSAIITAQAGGIWMLACFAARAVVSQLKRSPPESKSQNRRATSNRRAPQPRSLPWTTRRSMEACVQPGGAKAVFAKRASRAAQIRHRGSRGLRGVRRLQAARSGLLPRPRDHCGVRKRGMQTLKRTFKSLLRGATCRCCPASTAKVAASQPKPLWKEPRSPSHRPTSPLRPHVPRARRPGRK